MLSILELQSNLDARYIRKLTDGVALSIGHLEVVEVDHAYDMVEITWEYFFCGPSTSRRVESNVTVKAKIATVRI